jgi:hypothetical protein
MHTQFLGWRRNSSAFLFAVFFINKTPFYGKKQAYFCNILKINIIIITRTDQLTKKYVSGNALLCGKVKQFLM